MRKTYNSETARKLARKYKLKISDIPTSRADNKVTVDNVKDVLIRYNMLSPSRSSSLSRSQNVPILINYNVKPRTQSRSKSPPKAKAKKSKAKKSSGSKKMGMYAVFSEPVNNKMYGILARDKAIRRFPLNVYESLGGSQCGELYSDEQEKDIKKWEMGEEFDWITNEIITNKSYNATTSDHSYCN